ncbi:hypothetical protein A3J90_07775 [candidate division WOR-1 bacterium RIFOXYC2_FULL_37_10]|uniref:acylphosphatase n=1 Tax=candidate division WOR-1 bacterium RIFOXYB2_FULL_37_13 TaxID=1802579 RepID=A0A1F4SDY9_UNCSA|nr:MAG: hypothetical protein A2246_04120 [candidate division WOR-1 bacterium RIFOXYA2_FULL_37_7]OGC18648.1 MAG: hypothetical protein A2310_03385 [candidate division WOR-1 bacterium RIFOXYB2_FULL_37_13]OGC32431.1 MAG: hypothetical protein A3J90_07775 [candidate division WOR-1 bacterium RIFOXYC2_FULL_37_10]
MKKQVQVYYSGRVQGVGFRFTAQDIAAKYLITGFVRNLPDRRVEVVAEGEESEIRFFLDRLYSEMRLHIDKFNVNWSEGSGNFSSFTIKY